jgi:hypothetical protein
MAVVMALQSAPIYRLQKTWTVKIINHIITQTEFLFFF